MEMIEVEIILVVGQILIFLLPKHFSHVYLPQGERKLTN